MNITTLSHSGQTRGAVLEEWRKRVKWRTRQCNKMNMNLIQISDMEVKLSST